MAMKIPPRGNIIWFVKKSVASKKFFPKIVNSESRLKDRALKSPINQATKPNKAVAIILFIFKDSISHATPGSIRDIEELNAAILNSTKNRVPKNTPRGIELKAIGKVTKTRPGPSDGARPLAKTIGKIAIPANKATPVSSAATDIAVFPIF